LDADDLAGLLGTSGALNRVLVLDATSIESARAGEKPPTGFALRAAVERWSRAQGLYAIAACSDVTPSANGAPTPGLLTSLLQDAAGSGSGVASMAPTGREAGNAMGVMDWFNIAADRAGAVIQRLGFDPQVVQASTKPMGFPLLAATR
jgi:hypothetical protein